MSVVVEYRTITIETPAFHRGSRDFWYTGDNQPSYTSMEDALANSDVIKDWTTNVPSDLSVVRVRDEATGLVTFVSPRPLTR